MKIRINIRKELKDGENDERKETKEIKQHSRNKERRAKRGVPRVAEDTRELPHAAHIPAGRGTVPGQQSSTTAASEPPPPPLSQSLSLTETDCFLWYITREKLLYAP